MKYYLKHGRTELHTFIEASSTDIIPHLNDLIAVITNSNKNKLY